MTVYHLSLSVFMTNRTTSGLRKLRKSTNPGSYQQPSSLNRLKLLKTVSRILHQAVHQPITLLQLSRNLTKCSKAALMYGFTWGSILLVVCMCAKWS